MSDAFDHMMRACMDRMDDAELRSISVNLLRRIVQICAATTPVSEETPAVLYIRAFTLRLGDLVWRLNPDRFLVARDIETDSVGLIRVEFDDHSVAWYQPDEMVQIPVHRAIACEWNDRRRDRTATTVTI